jgi:hypothetical protein
VLQKTSKQNICAAAVILIKAMAAWQQDHGAPPSGAQQRRQFKSMIESWQRKVNGIPAIEENFQVRPALRMLLVPSKK